MNVKRKTVRFQDSLSDLAVYNAISDYKKYGYRSESHMVVEAVRRLIKDGSSELDPDTLADVEPYGNCSFETIAYIGSDVYHILTGR